jgi:hypothetical protein
MDLGVTPFVYGISCGQAVARLKGRRACRADLTGGSLSNCASDRDCGQPKRMVVASTSFVVALANKFAASLSDFGAMSSSSPQIECRNCQA